MGSSCNYREEGRWSLWDPMKDLREASVAASRRDETLRPEEEIPRSPHIDLEPLNILKPQT